MGRLVPVPPQQDQGGGGGGINTVYYAFDANDLYIDVKVNGNPMDYAAPNALTTSKYTIYVYFSPVNPARAT